MYIHTYVRMYVYTHNMYTHTYTHTYKHTWILYFLEWKPRYLFLSQQQYITAFKWARLLGFILYLEKTFISRNKVRSTYIHYIHTNSRDRLDREIDINTLQTCQRILQNVLGS